MITRSKILKALMICCLIWFPIHILYMITAAHLMMVTDWPMFSYVVSALCWGAVEAFPFLKLIHKSDMGKPEKIGLSIAAVGTSALILFLIMVCL